MPQINTPFSSEQGDAHRAIHSSIRALAAHFEELDTWHAPRVKGRALIWWQKTFVKTNHARPIAGEQTG